MTIDRQTIKNWRGKIVGFVETDEQGNKTIKDFYGKILGTYNKRLNITKDFYGRKLSNGDTGLMLLKYED